MDVRLASSFIFREELLPAAPDELQKMLMNGRKRVLSQGSGRRELMASLEQVFLFPEAFPSPAAQRGGCRMGGDAVLRLLPAAWGVGAPTVCPGPSGQFH